MRTLTHLIVGGIAATTLLAGTAVTASAQSTTIKDKRADVVQFKNLNDDGPGTVLKRADSTASGIDVTSAVVKHGKKSFKVTVRFADLTKGQVVAQSEIRIKGSSKRYNVTTFGSNKRVYVYDGAYEKRLCTAKLNRRTGKNGRLSFTIPRSCIKTPPALKLRTWVLGLPGGLDDDSTPVHMDAVSSTLFRNPSWTKWLKSS